MLSANFEGCKGDGRRGWDGHGIRNQHSPYRIRVGFALARKPTASCIGIVSKPFPSHLERIQQCIAQGNANHIESVSTLYVDCNHLHILPPNRMRMHIQAINENTLGFPVVLSTHNLATWHWNQSFKIPSARQVAGAGAAEAQAALTRLDPTCPCHGGTNAEPNSPLKPKPHPKNRIPTP